MQLLYFVLLLLAGICFGLAAGRVPVGRIDPLALGLLLWVIVPALQMLQKV